MIVCVRDSEKKDKIRAAGRAVTLYTCSVARKPYALPSSHLFNKTMRLSSHAPGYNKPARKPLMSQQTKEKFMRANL